MRSPVVPREILTGVEQQERPLPTATTGIDRAAELLESRFASRYRLTIADIRRLARRHFDGIRRSHARGPFVALCVGTLLLAGCGGQAAESPRPDEEWKSRSGDAWDAYVAGYRAGWNRGCERGQAGWIADAALQAGEAGGDGHIVVPPQINCSPPREDSIPRPDSAPEAPFDAGAAAGDRDGQNSADRQALGN